ncbi:MAG: hypothetical protein RL021_77, partial [Bacteroidota bacterium]
DMFLLPAFIGDLEMTVADRLGRIVRTEMLYKPAGSIHSLDLSSEAEGVYFLTLSNSEVSRTVRLVVTR